MRKTIISLIVIMSIFLVTGCGSKGKGDIPQVEANTIGTKLLNEFYTEISENEDIDAVAQKLIENELFSEMAMGTIEVEAGYLNGFDDEINGFSKGVMFAPMIGTIPFVGYIFETDDVDGLVNTLDSHAMLNWNICTVADEKVSGTYDKYVFYVMAPESFE